MPEHPAVRLTVNGEQVDLPVPGTVPLAYALRNDLGLLGVRVGCAVGECGACTVIAGGRAIRSCITALESVAGASIVTPEGLGRPGSPGPVQQAFIDEQAAQCGYCLNGLIMTVEAYHNGGPGLEECVRAALPEHLCRCGTHPRILRAIRRVAGESSRQSTVDPSTVDITEPLDAGAEHGARVEVPAALRKAPDVASWIGIRTDGRIEARTGKVELGQGLRTALAQIVAGQLGVSIERVAVCSASTDGAPDERYTAGTRSIEEGGAALAVAATAFRRLVLERAATAAGYPLEKLDLDDEGVRGPGGLLLTWAQLSAERPVTGPVGERDTPQWTGAPLGEARIREDLPAKLTGSAAFVHDLVLPGMVHARALLPPHYDAALLDLDQPSARAAPGVRAIVRDGRVVIAIAQREEQAVDALARLRRGAVWSDPGLDWTGEVETMLRALPAKTLTVRDDAGVPGALEAGAHRVTATYVRPYHAHAAVAPSCAVALDRDDRLTVWTHSQGVYPLRAELATLLEIPADRITLRHVDGPGCYGHNGADDAAAFAAIAARAVPGTPVRFQFSLADEMTWEPYGSAMLADLDGAVDEQGRLVAWRHRSRTDVHAVRPTGNGDRLVPAWLTAEPRRRPWPGPNDTGSHDVVPIYEVAAVCAATDFVRGPLRTSALRSLASFHNIFASESFIDELAEAAGRDPIEFRLANLGDPRARRVLEVAAAGCGWTPRVGPSGRGLGVAVSRYKKSKAYVAAAVQAGVDASSGQVGVASVLLVCDAGTVVNPDGLRNQLEGGALQGLSRTLYEEVRADAGGIASRDWASYPVLRFDRVPEVSTVLINRPDCPPLGVGEAAGPPVAAAVANAVDDAIGVRLRRMPFTRARIEQRLIDLTDDETRRCLL
ncbi:MAG: molybdopterin-dependent oxidoreductase [Micromonosporaceae bacterium]|nr:molybdopterin-dependent oxidoreductase [Micromonosporaceae bacterium]